MENANNVTQVTTYREQAIRKIESRAISQGISADEMMRRAGAAAFAYIAANWPEARSMVVFCGNGNNGGDGYVVARLAKIAGLEVTVRYLVPPETIQSNEAHHAYRMCRKQRVELKPFDDNEVFEVDLAVDALFGIGLKGELRGAAVAAIATINHLDCDVIALDIPSGLMADSGLTSTAVVIAEKTMTFIGIKQGMLMNRGPECCGEIICRTLDLPEALYET